MSNTGIVISRRAVLAGSGALVFSFSSAAFAQDSAAPPAAAPQPAPAPPPPLPGSLKQAPFLDSWIRIDADGAITVFTGKAELGQGIKTALIQIAAEQIDGKTRGRIVGVGHGRAGAEVEREPRQSYGRRRWCILLWHRLDRWQGGWGHRYAQHDHRRVPRRIFRSRFGIIRGSGSCGRAAA